MKRNGLRFSSISGESEHLEVNDSTASPINAVLSTVLTDRRGNLRNVTISKAKNQLWFW